jgi:hypothetical protein
MPENLDNLPEDLIPRVKELINYFDHVDMRVSNTLRDLLREMLEYEAERIDDRDGTGIVVIVNLPQSLDRISQFMEAIGNIWPGTMVNVKPDDAAAKLGNWLIEVEAK